MFPKENRLPGYAYNLIKTNGRNYHNKYFSILVYKRNDSRPTRLGIIVSKKVSDKSTQRNKVKRLFVLLLRKYLIQFKYGFDLIFLMKGNLQLEKPEIIDLNLREMLYNLDLLSR